MGTFCFAEYRLFLRQLLVFLILEISYAKEASRLDSI
jgi:hypothetical protein